MDGFVYGDGRGVPVFRVILTTLKMTLFWLNKTIQTNKSQDLLINVLGSSFRRYFFNRAAAGVRGSSFARCFFF